VSSADPLVGFVRSLRVEGISLGPAISADLVAALEVVGAERGEDVYWAFRALCVSRLDEVAAFNRVFVRFFGSGDLVHGHISEVVRSWSVRAGEGLADEGDDETDDSGLGASLRERLSGRDFQTLTEAETDDVRRLIAEMVWEPPVARSRRYRAAAGGRRPDMRRTLRRAVGVEGDLIPIATTMRVPRRRPLIFLLDISGSMERYAEMLLYFAHATKARFGTMEAFVFGTRLTRITRELSRRRPSEAIEKVAGSVLDWSGGTLIGDAIRDFNRQWVRRVGSRGPVVLIVSDGWDRGDPDLLATEMSKLHRSVHRVIWLNPLAGRPGYAPETRGLKAALPSVDDFIPAATLSDIETLIHLLESVSPTYA